MQQQITNNKTAIAYNVANFQTVKYGNKVGIDIKLCLSCNMYHEEAKICTYYRKKAMK